MHSKYKPYLIYSTQFQYNRREFRFLLLFDVNLESLHIIIKEIFSTTWFKVNRGPCWTAPSRTPSSTGRSRSNFFQKAFNWWHLRVYHLYLSIPIYFSTVLILFLFTLLLSYVYFRLLFSKMTQHFKMWYLAWFCRLLWPLKRH